MPTVADEEMEQKQPSGHRPEGFCCSIMVGHDVCHYCEAAERSARRAVYAECICIPMLTATSMQTSIPPSCTSYTDYSLQEFLLCMEVCMVANYK